jgi:hypothetical protein
MDTIWFANRLALFVCPHPTRSGHGENSIYLWFVYFGAACKTKPMMMSHEANVVPTI